MSCFPNINASWLSYGPQRVELEKPVVKEIRPGVWECVFSFLIHPDQPQPDTIVNHVTPTPDKGY